jgi:hypothetical protein
MENSQIMGEKQNFVNRVMLLDLVQETKFLFHFIYTVNEIIIIIIIFYMNKF